MRQAPVASTRYALLSMICPFDGAVTTAFTLASAGSAASDGPVKSTMNCCSYARAGGPVPGAGHGRPAPRRPGLAGQRRPARPGAGAGARMSVRVLLADDEALVRAGLRMILEAEDDLEVVGEAGDGVEARRALPRPAAGRGARRPSDAPHGRRLGGPPDQRRPRPAHRRRHAHDLRRRRTRGGGTAGGSHRVPAQVDAARAARQRRPRGRPAATRCSRRSCCAGCWTTSSGARATGR